MDSIFNFHHPPTPTKPSFHPEKSESAKKSQNDHTYQLCIFLQDLLLPSFTNRRNFVISFLKIIKKMSEMDHSYSVSVSFGVADLVWCECVLQT